MFDSGIKASALLGGLKNEIDVALPISDEQYVEWLNSCEQFLYSSILHIQHECEIKLHNASPNSEVSVGEDEDTIRFDDIVTVYADDTQLIKTTLATSMVFDCCYYEKNGNLQYKCPENTQKIHILYNVRPRLKVVENGKICDDTIKIPLEYIDLVKSKIRADAYMYVNESATAANWINLYNAWLETFKQWYEKNYPTFGI